MTGHRILVTLHVPSQQDMQIWGSFLLSSAACLCYRMLDGYVHAGAVLCFEVLTQIAAPQNSAQGHTGHECVQAVPMCFDLQAGSKSACAHLEAGSVTSRAKRISLHACFKLIPH